MPPTCPARTNPLRTSTSAFPRALLSLTRLSLIALPLFALSLIALTLPAAANVQSQRDTATAAEAAAPTTASHSLAVATLAPFSGEYAAFRASSQIGRASLRLVHGAGTHWRIDLAVQADRGIAGALGLDLQQSTVFEEHPDGWRPLSQSSVRKGLFLGKRTAGRYDWTSGTAQWNGDLKPRHRAPVPLRPGDLSGLLINLAIVRDAAPGRELQYRFVEGGRAREHVYRVAPALDDVTVDELNYAAMRVERSNGGNDETIVWVVEGVPTPVRILQREDGEDLFDLRLIAYQGN